MKLDKIDITGQNKKQMRKQQDLDDSASPENSARFKSNNNSNCIDNFVYKTDEFISENFYIKRTSKIY